MPFGTVLDQWVAKVNLVDISVCYTCPEINNRSLFVHFLNTGQQNEEITGQHNEDNTGQHNEDNIGNTMKTSALTCSRRAESKNLFPSKVGTTSHPNRLCLNQLHGSSAVSTGRLPPLP